MRLDWRGKWFYVLREHSKDVWEASTSITFSYTENIFHEVDLMKMPFIS